jgi:hypothetical protein
MVLAGIISGGLVGAVPVVAEGEESSVDAEVNVIDGSEAVFGGNISAYRNVLFPTRVLGKPDLFTAWLYYRGWINIELTETVPDCTSVSIWAGYFGWSKVYFQVYTSPDGYTWKLAGNIRSNSPGIKLYELSGDYGNVRYIRVKLVGSRWALGLLDAVSAKGGDAGTD